MRGAIEGYLVSVVWDGGRSMEGRNGIGIYRKDYLDGMTYMMRRIFSLQLIMIHTYGKNRINNYIQRFLYLQAQWLDKMQDLAMASANRKVEELFHLFQVGVHYYPETYEECK